MDKTVTIHVNIGRHLGQECERARERLSVELDEPLGELERTRVEAHLALCEACRAFRAELHDLASVLRTAPLERPEFPVVLPRRRLVSIRALQAGAAAAAVALVAGLSSLGIVGSVGSSHQTNVPAAHLSPFTGDQGDEVVPLRSQPLTSPRGNRIAV